MHVASKITALIQSGNLHSIPFRHEEIHHIIDNNVVQSQTREHSTTSITRIQASNSYNATAANSNAIPPTKGPAVAPAAFETVETAAVPVAVLLALPLPPDPVAVAPELAVPDAAFDAILVAIVAGATVLSSSAAHSSSHKRARLTRYPDNCC